MKTTLQFDILPQPDDTTCGPTCLQAVYRYYDDEVPLGRLIGEVDRWQEGGTLAVLLGCHALRRGYSATIYTYNVEMFDPTWFLAGGGPLAERLAAQKQAKESAKIRAASDAYMEFLRLGGNLRMRDLSGSLIRAYLNKDVPILTGLSATYLYGCEREYGPNGEPDDVRGVPVGHFVVLCGYDKLRRKVLVADPLMPNPISPEHIYEVGLERAICAILLGIVTYDANLLIIRPPRERRR
jgi:hypothetical protein